MTATLNMNGHKMSAERAARLAVALRQAAELFDTVDLPEPLSMSIFGYRDRPIEITWYLYASEREAFVELVRTLPKDGPADKAPSGTAWIVKIPIRGGLLSGRIQLADVCEKVQVGEETYTEQVPVEPAEPVEMVEVTKTRPVFETRCPESLLDLDG